MTTERKSAEEIRALLALEPALLELADSLKARFGARLTALRAGTVSVGWERWEAERARAEPPWTFPKDLSEGSQEWARIKAKALKAGDAARRKPTSVRRGGVG